MIDNILGIIVAVLCVVLFQVILARIKNQKYNEKGVGAKNQIHLFRRIQHVGSGFVILLLGQTRDYTFMKLGTFGGVCFLFFVYLLRKYSKDFDLYFTKNYRFLLRKQELANRVLPGGFYFLLGIFISIFLFKYQILVLSVVILSVGDPFASMIGIQIQSYEIYKGKTLSGSIGGALVASVVCYFTKYIYFYKEEVDQISFMSGSNYSYIFICFVVAFIAELGPSSRKYYLDDNFTIPIYAGTLFTLIDNFYN